MHFQAVITRSDRRIKRRHAAHPSYELDGHQKGYYLVVERTGERFWFAASFWDAVNNLNKACNKHLTDDDCRYWVDYSYGLDINGAPAWDNLDHSESLLDRGA